MALSCPSRQLRRRTALALRARLASTSPAMATSRCTPHTVTVATAASSSTVPSASNDGACSAYPSGKHQSAASTTARITPRSRRATRAGADWRPDRVARRRVQRVPNGKYQLGRHDQPLRSSPVVSCMKGEELTAAPSAFATGHAVAAPDSNRQIGPPPHVHGTHNFLV